MRSRVHSRLGRAVSRYADGELDAAAVRALETHLLECESCRLELATVLAIKGSLRRLADEEPPTLAATRLRRWVENPSGLCTRPSSQPQDRVGILAGSGRYRRRAQVGVLAVVVAVIAATGALLLRGQSPADPGTVTALVELARVGLPVPPAAQSGQDGDQLPPAHTVELGGRRVSLRRESPKCRSDRSYGVGVPSGASGRRRTRQR